MKKNLTFLLLLIATFQLSLAQDAMMMEELTDKNAMIQYQDELVLLEGGDGILSIPVSAEYQYKTECLIIIFTNTSLNSINQLWTFGDGDSSNIENPIHYYDEPGTYEINLYVFSATGELDTASKEITIDICTGIEDAQAIEDQNIKHSIYPNPVGNQDILTIQFDNLRAENKASLGLQIFDIMGRKMLDLSSIEATNKISISNWPKGIYYYELLDKKSRQSVVSDNFVVK